MPLCESGPTSCAARRGRSRLRSMTTDTNDLQAQVDRARVLAELLQEEVGQLEEAVFGPEQRPALRLVENNATTDLNGH